MADARPTITVDALALRSVLQALIGPAHRIRELQATRSLHKMGHPNPIDILLEQFNAGGAPLADAQAEAAAKVLAECMDYPWEPMPAEGQETMREHVRKVVAAARLKVEEGAA